MLWKSHLKLSFILFRCDFEYMYDFMPRSICVAEVVNGKLFSARSLNIRFMEADATIEGMTAKVMEALGSNEPVTLLDSKGNEILDSEFSRSKLYDQTVLCAYKLWFRCCFQI